MERLLHTAGQVNRAMLRPFGERIPLRTPLLLFVILLAVAGQWHIVLEHIDRIPEEAAEEV